MFNSASGILLIGWLVSKFTNYHQASFEHALNMKDTRSLSQGHQQLTSQIHTAKRIIIVIIVINVKDEKTRT